MSRPWIKRPVVLLGIAFNAVYFAYCISGGAPGPARAGRTLRAPDDAGPAVALHNSLNADAPEVYTAEDLILIRSEGRGLVFSPLYIAQRRAPRGSQMVTLRFYSFSRTTHYDLNRQLRMMADGREVWLDAAANYSLDEGANGEAVESLIDQIPLDVFARAAGARVLKITVGPEEIELSPGHIEALRRLAWCAFTGGCGRDERP
jgi:hypothetical protein